MTGYLTPDPAATLDDLRWAEDVLTERQEMAAETQAPDLGWPRFNVLVRPAELRDAKVLAAAEGLATHGPEFGIGVMVPAKADELGQFGGSQLLRDHCAARWVNPMTIIDGKPALTRLQDARRNLAARMDRAAHENNRNPTFPRIAVAVDSDDLTDRDAVRLAEDIARLGRKFSVFVDIDAEDESLVSYGGSPVLRACWMAGREDYVTERDR